MDSFLFRNAAAIPECGRADRDCSAPEARDPNRHNAVYHPADYALLSQHVPAERIGPAFSFHTFAGMAGSAAAPPTLLMMQSVWGWRGAFIGASALGFAVALMLIASHGQAEGRADEAMPHYVEAARAIEPLCMLWCIPGFIRNDWMHAFKLLTK